MTGPLAPSSRDVARLDLPPHTGSVRDARQFALRRLDDWRLEDLGWAVALVVAELATNAVEHAATPFSLELARSPHELEVSVADGSPQLPVLRRGGRDEVSGRGLRVVQRVSRSWGVDTTDTGKIVWCRIATEDDA